MRWNLLRAILLLATASLSVGGRCQAGQYTIKLFVPYTEDAAARAKDLAQYRDEKGEDGKLKKTKITGIRAAILDAVDDVDMVFANSGLNVRWRLTYELIPKAILDESVIDKCGLAAQAAANGPLIRKRKEQHADIVVLLVGNYDPDAAGCVHRVAPLDIGRDVVGARAAAFAVADVHESYKEGAWTMAHEIGHLFGARHDVSSGGGPAPAYAYRDQNRKFGTIMAVRQNGWVRIPEFSHPGKCHAKGFEQYICGSEDEYNNLKIVKHNLPHVGLFGKGL